MQQALQQEAGFAISSGIYRLPMLGESRCKNIWFSCQYLETHEAGAVAVEGMKHAESMAGGRGPKACTCGSGISDLSCSRFAYSTTAPCKADWDVLRQSPMGHDEWAGQLPVVGHWATLFARSMQHKHATRHDDMRAGSHQTLQRPVSTIMLHSDVRCFAVRT